MSPIALGNKHQDLLKAYLEVSKSEKPDWTSVALKADFATAKYARDQFAIVKKKLLTTPNGEPISLSDTHLTLLQTVIGVLKADTDWEKVAQLAEFKTPKYARDQWAIVRNKLSGASATSAAATPTSNRGTPSRKRKKREDTYGGEEGEEGISSDKDKTPAKTSKTLKWKKKLRKKEKMKKVKVEVEESDAEVQVNDNDQTGETDGLQAQVDEQIQAEMQEKVDDQAFEADMFRMD